MSKITGKLFFAKLMKIDMPSGYFFYFTIILPLKRAWPFTWPNPNQCYLSVLCNWKKPSGRDANVKRLLTVEGTDIRRSEKLTWVFSLFFNGRHIWDQMQLNAIQKGSKCVKSVHKHYIWCRVFTPKKYIKWHFDFI